MIVVQRSTEERIREEPLTSHSQSRSHNPEPKGEDKSPAPVGPGAPEDASEYFLELLTDTLEQMESGIRAAFLQRFLKSLASVDVSETESLTHWQEVLRRREELSERLGRPVTLRTAAIDYFGTRALLRNPILLEYRELKRLRHNAATDSLTGLYNRRLFDEHFAKELNRSRRYSYPVTLLLFDLRNFKKANDTYGHTIGDEVLRSLARACGETIRGSDYPCRLGGDEFAVILPQSEGQSVHALAERIVQKFEEYALPMAPDAGLGLDYGVASFPVDGDAPTSLFEVADGRLYAYKKGRKQRGAQAAAEPTPVAAPGPPPTEPELVAVPPLPPGFELEQYTAAKGGSQAHQRRYERISLANSNAYGVLRGGFGTKVVRVLDLGFGGVSFMVDEASRAQIPDVFHARLHVPILPAAEYRIRRVYTHPLAQGMCRIGCQFNLEAPAAAGA